MAFTLTEVLITLLVIGVVAGLVIPELIYETRKAEYVAKLQKEAAVLNQAFKLIELDAGGSILNNPNFNCSSSSCHTTAAANAMNDFANILNVVKNCGSETGCLYNSPQKFLGENLWASNLDSYWSGMYGKAILADGTMIVVDIYNSNCAANPDSGVIPPVYSPLYNSICGDIDVDTLMSGKNF